MLITKVLVLTFISILFFSTLISIHSVGSANAQFNVPESLPEIIIESDGSINPPTPFIKQQENQYTLTNDLIGKYAILVRCSNIVIDGENHTIDGENAGNRGGGIDIDRVSNVTVKNIKITNFFFHGLVIGSSPNCSIINSHFTNNHFMGIVIGDSPNCSIINNYITSNGNNGIALTQSNNVVVTKNKISNNVIAINLDLSNENDIFRNEIFEDRAVGFCLLNSQGNIIHKNNVTDCVTGIAFNHAFASDPSRNVTASNNSFFLNNFVNNSVQVSFQYDIFENLFDNGREGNFWSEYNGIDSNGDGIGDTAYVFDDSNVDNYPLVACFNINTEGVLPTPSPSPEPFLTTLAVVSIATIAIIGMGILFYFKKIKKN